MKTILYLTLAVVVASPVFGLTEADLEQIREIMEATNAKTEARLKAYVDIKIGASEKATMAKIEASEKSMTAELTALRNTTTAEIKALRETTTTELRAVKDEVKTSRTTLYWWIGLSIGVFGFFYYQMHEMQRTMGRLLERTDLIVEEWVRRSAELDAQREENAALRAENKRLKNQLANKGETPAQPSVSQDD